MEKVPASKKGRGRSAASPFFVLFSSFYRSDACGRYGFHDFRRAFATVNADVMTPDALQALMRHKSYATTQRYINMAKQINRAVDNIVVPDMLKADSA